MRIAPGAAGARNHTQCDSLLIGPECRRAPSRRGGAQRRRRRARSHHHAHLRGAHLLLPAARHRAAGNHLADRRRLLPGRARRAADGVRARGARCWRCRSKARSAEPRPKEPTHDTPKTHPAATARTACRRGRSPCAEVGHARRTTRRAAGADGRQRQRQEHAGHGARRAPALPRRRWQRAFAGQDLLASRPRRARAGLFVSFQAPPRFPA